MRPIRVRWIFKLDAFTQRNSRAINIEIDFLAYSRRLTQGLVHSTRECGIYHNEKETSPSGGFRMTHASNSGLMEIQARRLHATQIACNQYRN